MLVKFKKIILFVIILALASSGEISSFSSGEIFDFDGRDYDFFIPLSKKVDTSVLRPVDLSRVCSPPIVGDYITMGNYHIWLKMYLRVLSGGDLGEFCNDATAQKLYNFICYHEIGTPIVFESNPLFDLFKEKYNELKKKINFQEIIISEDYLAENIYFMAWKIYKDYSFDPNLGEIIQMLQDIFKFFNIDDLKLNYLQYL